jgi:RNA polymerase sigma-70 factor (ECF subfamily)
VTAVDPFVIQQAEIRASRLIGSHGFTRDDWDDLRQDLLLDYLERLPQFDGDRGNPRGFMFGVVRHRAAQLAARQRRQVPLVPDGSTETGGSRHRHTAVNYDLRLDLEAAVSRLPQHLRAVAQMLSDRTPREVARITGKSRSRVYQMIQEIRGAFVEAGVTPEALRQCGGAR